jgi:hypothetical protein
MKFLALLNINRKYTTSYRQGVEVEYSIRIPGFHGELTKRMSPAELDKFIAESNGKAKAAVGESSMSMGNAISRMMRRTLNGRVEGSREE